MSTTNTSLAAGTVLHSPERDYTILKVLGQGGFGITYLVEGTVKVGNIDARVKFAVKEYFLSNLCGRQSDSHEITYMPTAADEVSRSLNNFIKEGRRLQELGIAHPNIVKINEVFEANNTAYYVMEYLEGETLYDMVQRVGKLDEAATERYLRPIAEAVSMLHGKKLAHYDIKPLNIIINRTDKGERPVLIDFGLAKHYDHEGNATSTNSGGAYSPGYAPAEQYAGLKSFTPEADVYALAATALYCLTGKTPADAFKFKTSNLPALLPDASDKTRAAIAHAMQLRGEDRPNNARRFVDEMWGNATPAAATPATKVDVDPNATQRINKQADPGIRAPKPPKPPTTSNNTWIWVVVAILAAVAIGGGAYYFFGRSGGGLTVDDDTEMTDTIAEDDNWRDSVATDLAETKIEQAEDAKPETTKPEEKPAESAQTANQSTSTQRVAPTNNTSNESNRRDPSGTISRVWFDHNVTQGGKTGMRIHVNFTVNDMAGQEVVVWAWFYEHGASLDGPDGDAILVNTSKSITSSPQTVSDCTLFVPYSQFKNLSAGNHTIDVQVELDKNRTTEFARRNGNFVDINK